MLRDFNLYIDCDNIGQATEIGVIHYDPATNRFGESKLGKGAAD